MDLSSSPIGIHHRLIWAASRAVLEADIYKHRKYGKKAKRRWTLFEATVRMFGLLMRLTPLHRVGLQNARDIRLNRIDLRFDDLPRQFHGYTILHLTDLHLDFIPGISERIRACIQGLAVDLCVLTGDYRKDVSGGFKSILTPLHHVVSGISARDGIFATLGNHDTYQMVDALEDMGMTVLVNETRAIKRKDAEIRLTGLDDPYYYYTDQALTALEQTPKGFKIALVHAPSLFDIAADNGYRLYLCGHTHGGQICLPGGHPIIVHLRHGRKYYRGLWRYRGMTGYTGQGTGTIGVPLRFNTSSEITLFRLHCGET